MIEWTWSLVFLVVVYPVATMLAAIVVSLIDDAKYRKRRLREKVGTAGRV